MCFYFVCLMRFQTTVWLPQNHYKIFHICFNTKLKRIHYIYNEFKLIMKPIVELISAWDDFTSERTGEISVKEFCEFYLNKVSASKINPTSNLNQDMARVIGR